MGKIGYDNDGTGAAVPQLVLKFAWRIQRVDVHYDHPGAQYAKQGDRILQQVGHHQCHPIAFLQTQALLQVGRK